ncbi:MAG: YidC/Oxa1 family membrane protein insertase, partial [Candidatus Ventricola sp.]
QELYRKEGVSPMGGCLPMIISMFILFAMFYALRTFANEQLVAQFLTFYHNPEIDPSALTDGFLWIKNLWMPDSPFATYMPDVKSLQLVDYQVWNDVSAKLVAAGTIPEALSFVDRNAMMAYITDVVTPFIASDVYAPYIAPVAGLGNLSILGLIRFTIYQHGNGWFVLPILSVATQIVMQNMTMKQTMQANPQAGSQKTMLYVMTFMSLYFCAIYNSAFALYWVVSNIYALVENIAFDRYFKAQDRKAAKAEEVGI